MTNPVIVFTAEHQTFCNIETKRNDKSNVPKTVKRSMYLVQDGSEQIAFTGLTAEQGGAATGVEEEILALCHILEVNLGATVHFRENT